MNSDLSKIYEQRISVWKKNILTIKKHDHNFNWIVKNHKLIENFIKSNYTNLNSLRSHLSTLTAIIKHKKGENSRIYKHYSKKAIAIQKKIEDGYKDQTLPKNRVGNHVSFEEIEKRREQLKELFNENKTDHKLNLQYLLLALYTYQPPLRQDYKDMMIVQDKVPNKKENFLLKKRDQWFVIIQQDKVIRAQGSAVFELNQLLGKIINVSLMFFPRKYILSALKDPNKPIGKQGFEKLLRDCFENKKVTVDILRSAYVTNKYNDNTFSMRQKEDLARSMRHSVSIAQRIYHKIISDVPINEQNVTPLEKTLTEDEIISDFITKLNYSGNIEQLKIDIKHCIEKNKSQPIIEQQDQNGFNIKEWGKIYRSKHKDEILSKRKKKYEVNKRDILRNKIIYNANNQRSKPRDSTIKKYNLVYDGVHWT